MAESGREKHITQEWERRALLKSTAEEHCYSFSITSFTFIELAVGHLPSVVISRSEA